MRMNRRFAALAVAAGLLAGCAGTEVKVADNPFAGDRVNAPLHKLSLALVLPTVKAVSKDGKAVELGALAQQNEQRYDELYREVFGIFYQDFKSVTLVKSLQDPRVGEADLNASLDVALVTNPQSLTLTSSFYGPDHGLIATMKTEAPGGSTLFAADPDKVFANLIPQVPDKLDAQLLGSAELKAFSKGLSGKPAASRGEARAAKAFDSDVDRPSYNYAENADDYAVVVGVENYQNLPAAEFASRDAKAVRAHLKALGYPGQNIAMLTDAQATGNAIKSYVESWLPRNVKPGSKVFFYFSGHGAPDADTQQAYLVPWDADPQFLADTGYPLKRLYSKLNGLKAKEVIVAMDSCFSGAGGHSVIAKGARPLMTRVDTGSAADMGKVTVLAAAGGEEITGEEENQGHGLFTYYLLRGLNEGDGKNTVASLYQYLKPKVEAAARQSNRSQTPQIISDAQSGASDFR